MDEKQQDGSSPVNTSSTLFGPTVAGASDRGDGENWHLGTGVTSVYRTKTGKTTHSEALLI